MGLVDDLDIVYDDRMARRLKRKHLDVPSFKLNTSGHTIMRTSGDNQLEDGKFDGDWEKFLIFSGKYKETGYFKRKDNNDVVDDEGDTDPQYKMFLEKLREDGKSYALEVIKSDGTSELIKYEEECMSDNVCEPQTRRMLRSAAMRENTEAAKDLRRSSRNVKRDSVIKKRLRTECLNPASHWMKECSNVKRDLDDNYNPGPQGKFDVEQGVTDECYRTFLNCMKVEGHSIVFEIGNIRMLYEEDIAESSSDSDILVLDKSPYCAEGIYDFLVGSRTFDASIEEDDCWCLGSPSKNNHSQFREKLIDILKMPYDQKEFDELWREMEARKPVEGHHDLRGGRKSFPTDRCSKSYLDHYSDVKRKLQRVQFDQLKMLNILRGFFYWLQNLTCEGAFIPWLDRSCLEVMPGCC